MGNHSALLFMALEPLNLAAFDEHLTRVIDDLPVPFTWNGKPYTGTRSSTDNSQLLVVGGVEQKIEYQLFIKTSTMTATRLPHEGDIFIMDNERMRVVRTRRSPDSVLLLTCDMAFSRQEAPNP